MIDRKPNLAAYARVSYLRELNGDLEGAAEAMRLAVAAGGPAPENNAYVLALLGSSSAASATRREARRSFGMALALVPRLPGRRGGPGAPRRHGPARLRADRRHAPAARVRRRPRRDASSPPATPRRARKDLALVAAEQQLQRAAGVDVDVELAVFEADHGSPAKAVALARRGWDAAPSVRAADALGWALTRSGDAEAGYRWARRALKLGSLDPIWRAHAGLSALAAGKPQGGPPAAADRARARPGRLSVAGAARSSCAAVIRSGRRRAMCGHEPADPAQHRPLTRHAGLHGPPVGARGAARRRRAADRGAARRRRRPRVDLPQPGDAGVDRDRAPRAPRPRSRSLRADRPRATAGRPAKAAAARPRCPPRRLQAIRLAAREAAGFEPAFTHFPLVGLCGDCRAT